MSGMNGKQVKKTLWIHATVAEDFGNNRYIFSRNFLTI